VVGDADRREARVEEVGVAVSVVLERLRRGVELAAVEFDDEVVFSVDGVDFVAGDGLVSLGSGRWWRLRKRVQSSSRVDLVAPRSGVSRAVRRPG
jgi:hypothetical protein